MAQDVARGTVQLANKSGLHARPAAVFVKTVARYREAKVRVTSLSNGKVADAKSILQVLSLGASFGDRIELEVVGPGAQMCLDSLREFVEVTLPKEDV